MEPRIDELVHELINAVEEQNKVDIVAAFTSPLPITVIAEILGVPVADRERVLDGLEQRGLLERRRGERDARVSEVVLTQRGRDLCQAADITHRRIVNEIFLGKLSAEEVEVFARVWRRLLGKPGKMS